MLPQEERIPIYKNNGEEDRTTQGVKAEFCRKVLPEKAIGMDDYARRMFDSLAIGNHGVFITGGKGVGKTALVKHLQYLMANYKCPSPFYGGEIYEMDMFALSSQIKSLAEYEDRIMRMFSSIYNNSSKEKQMFLFIDNISTFISKNNINLMSAMYLENAVKLSGIPIICCCNLNDRKQLENEYDLFRHFTEIRVKETDIEKTKDILQYKTDEVCRRFNVTISKEITDRIVTLSDKYLKNEFLMPKKAMNVLEYVAAKHVNDMRMPGNDVSQKIEIATALRENINEMAKSLNRDSGDIRDIIKKYNELVETENLIRNNPIHITQEEFGITENDVYTVISDLAGVPVAKLTESDTSKLKNMESSIEAKVIGQDETIAKVCKTIKRNRLGLRKKNHTIGNFLFLGSTGVGKTFLAKKISEYMFGSEESMTRLDMSEYTDEISVNKLIGAPPGYVGYGEGGVLCNAIKNNPYSVILFDEIEKAHPAIYNTILQLMDEGRITDANGNKISATNNIVIMTSNIGVKEAQNAANLVGFSVNASETEKKNSEHRKDIINKSMKKLFSPEFLNRIDGVCHFNDLNTDNLSLIFDNEIKEVVDSVSELGYILDISKDVKNWIVEKSEKEKLGARPLIRFIQQDIVDEVTELIINEEVGESKTIQVKYDEKNDKLKFGRKQDNGKKE